MSAQLYTGPIYASCLLEMACFLFPSSLLSLLRWNKTDSSLASSPLHHSPIFPFNVRRGEPDIDSLPLSSLPNGAWHTTGSGTGHLLGCAGEASLVYCHIRSPYNPCGVCGAYACFLCAVSSSTSSSSPFPRRLLRRTMHASV